MIGHVFIANRITEADKKRAVFFSMIGANTYKLFLNMIAPNKPRDKSFTFLVETLSEHFTPSPSKIVGFTLDFANLESRAH